MRSSKAQAQTEWPVKEENRYFNPFINALHDENCGPMNNDWMLVAGRAPLAEGNVRMRSKLNLRALLLELLVWHLWLSLIAVGH